MKTTSSAAARAEQWGEIIGQQRTSGVSVRAFCRQRGLCDHTFYMWRKRLANEQDVRFALVETNAAPGLGNGNATLELAMPGGECLRIPAGIDAATLRTVLAVLRERS